MKNFFLPLSLLIVTATVLEAKGKLRVRRAIGLKDESFRWPHNTVSYMFMTDRKAITVGMKRVFKELEAKTCLKFREVSKYSYNPPYHIRITHEDDGCNSMVGYWGSQPSTTKRTHQTLNFSPKCLWFGTFRHELGHAIGLGHMMQAPDRDTYITVHKSNVQAGEYDGNFKVQTKDKVSYFGGKYDFASVMHYGYNAFARNPSRATITAKDSNNDKYFKNFGNTEYSFFDLYTINKMYKCNSHCRTYCPEGQGYFDKWCRCVKPSDPSFANWPPQRHPTQQLSLATLVKSGVEPVEDVTSEWTEDTNTKIYKLVNKPAFVAVFQSANSIPDDLFIDDAHVNNDGNKNQLAKGFLPPQLDKHFRTWVLVADSNFKIGSSSAGVFDMVPRPKANCFYQRPGNPYTYLDQLKVSGRYKKIDLLTLGVPNVDGSTKATLFYDENKGFYILKLNNEKPKFQVEEGNKSLQDKAEKFVRQGGCTTGFSLKLQLCYVMCNTQRGP